MDDKYSRLKDWVLHSGLVISDNSDENIGGVHSFYDENDKKYGFLYPEITGYFLSTLTFLNHVEPNDEYVNKAKLSANWLISINEKFGGIIQGISSEKIKQKFVYPFDVGICMKGILDCYKITNDEVYLNFAKKQAQWMLNEAIEEDGSIKPVKNLLTNLFEEDKSVWYKQKGCLHIKTAIPFFELYKITKEKYYLEKANLICKNFARFQNDDGSISIHENSKTVHLHTLCYALEGLLHGYSVTLDDKLLQDCIKTANWCVKNINEDGSINLWFNSKYQQAKTSYHIAQLIRILLILNNISKNNYDVEKLFRFLSSLQSDSGTKQTDGGFYEEMYKTVFSWKKRSRLNSWGSMFALQAIFWKNNQTQINVDDISYLY